MIDIDGIRKVLKEANIYGKESNSNFICKCIYCGDKKSNGGHKHYHCYISKKDNVPCGHCFYCGTSFPITKLLYDLTGNKREDLIIPVNNKNYVKRNVSNVKQFKLPELDTMSFPLKTLYVKRRVFNKIDVTDVPNLIFDIREFFNINGLKISDYVCNPIEQQYIQDNMICFLSKRNTILYCRAISNNVPIKFKKIILQDNYILPGLDYYSIDNNNYDSDVIVLSEGNFDILGCYSLDTLQLKDIARVYCSGCTFSYEQLLKSVCIDYGIYNPHVYILSDSDKHINHYNYFLRKCKPIFKDIRIYYNSVGKDFGNYPHVPVKIF